VGFEALQTAEREPYSLEDADATVETLLLMEYADVGTLDQRIVQGRLKGDLVSALCGMCTHGCEAYEMLKRCVIAV
jgi:hypothetical protein